MQIRQFPAACVLKNQLSYTWTFKYNLELNIKEYKVSTYPRFAENVACQHLFWWLCCPQPTVSTRSPHYNCCRFLNHELPLQPPQERRTVLLINLDWKPLCAAAPPSSSSSSHLHTLSDACLHTGLHESFTGTKKKKKKLNLILCVSCKMPHHGPEAFKMPLRASLIRSITIRVDVRHEEEAARKWPKRQFDCKNTGQLLITADVGKVRRTQDLFQCYFYPPCVVYH